MKKLYSSLLAFSFLFAATTVDAQCPGGRYKDQIFSNTTKTADILFGNNVNVQGNAQDLFLDVYEPTGDVETNRPLIIFAHGGSFIGGSKDGTDVVPLCEDFAKMGYVTASIDYRLGMNNFPFPGPDSADATEAVLRGYHDMKAAVRFFRKDVAENGNNYGIDPNRVIIGGVSAGAFLALHVAYLDDVSEIPTFVDTTQAGLGGGLEGQSGNLGYSSDAMAIINYAGALRDSAWIKAGDEPIVSFHGDVDQTVPYGSDVITLVGIYPLLQVDGSFSIHAKANELGITNCFDTQEGQDHVPQVSNAAYYDTCVVITRNFLQHFICGDPLDCSYSNPLAIEDIDASVFDLDVYPNPAEEVANITFSLDKARMVKVSVNDLLGREVMTLAEQKMSMGEQRIELNNSTLNPGIYIVRLIIEGTETTRKFVVK